jgi:hypothetical protein
MIRRGPNGADEAPTVDQLVGIEGRVARGHVLRGAVIAIVGLVLVNVVG